ncbi:MAG TPA: GNAT family N-acetyltransferase [Acidimicrobiales bacterium]|nr:GNAT family N-acetyltransferase [Acidimicrobiales bacterium]
MSSLRFERCDPDDLPASELLAEMEAELNAVYETDDRLGVPRVSSDDLKPPGGVYLVGWSAARAVAGGGVRRLAEDLGEVKRMYVRPEARGRGYAACLLGALEEAATSLGYAAVRLDTGPRQLHALRLYQGAGYAEIAPYNDNPFASYWAEKRLER